jgi:hypothetical protein
LVLALITLMSAISIFGQAQASAADLSGTVVDPNGAVVAGATVTAKNLATGISRTVTANDAGEYKLIGLPPGEYEVTSEGTGFKKTVISPVKLTVGQSAELAVKLEIGAQNIVVNISGDDAQLVETTKTTVSTTIDQARIANLPINERSATGFALTISTVGRDNGRPVGPAPTSGLNIGGQRGRSTLVQVDGADFTDNSINAARSTVSQEAVQEYQVTTNSYMPEFGRATGGIINVVTKRGGNALNGNVFGFIRDKSVQSRNAFAPIIDGDPKKRPPYTRVQYGFTVGGPIIKNRTFFFGSFEQRRRQESGFFTGDIVGGGTSSVTIPVIPGLNPISRTFSGLTPGQVNYINTMIGLGTPTAVCTARAYAFLVGIGAATALNGTTSQPSPNDGSGCPAISPIGPGVIGQRFLLSGTPVPLTTNSLGQYVAFRPLSQLARIFPISEASTFTSIRLDHLINEGNQLSIRFSYNPSNLNGIQDESQNQTLGQNDYSRTGIQDIKDTSFSASLSSILPGNMVNEAYFTFGRRKATFDSQVPSVADQIAGTAFIGSNPFSPVNRSENRFQIRDNMTMALRNHTIKYGLDFNWIDVKARFELNFPALFNFSQQAGSSLISGCDSAALPAAQRCPSITPIQSYGLGFPSVFIQGFGDPNSQIKNKPVAFFVQDTWKVTKNFTLNYGLRYDVEFTKEFAPTPFKDPLTGITLTAADVQVAQDTIGVTQGFPRDKNNFAPRLGAAWDVMGDGKTVIRAAAGLYYDHPLLAVAFNSDIADGSQQQQATLLPIGGPSPTGLFNAFQVFHGTVCGVQGSVPAICGASITPGVASSAQYQFGYQRFNSATFTGFGPVLPFTLNVIKDFQYPYAGQGNLSIERQIGKDMSISASFITVQARHLAHPQDVNIVQTDQLVENFRRFAVNNPGFPGCTTATPNAPSCFPPNLSTAAFFPMPTTSNALFTVVIPGLIAVNNTTGQRFVSPIAADYFRRVGPNYFFIASVTGGAVTKAIFDSQLAGSVRAPGPINPYADVNAQMSDGNSSYNALNIELKKRFSNNIQLFATYTWSHSIDSSSDLQTLLKPQDNTDFRNETSDSLFDQRHRFVFSGIFASPDKWKSGSGLQKFMYGFSVAPIIEISSGRPFNIIAVGDANGDFQSTNERPFVLADGTLCRGQNTASADPNDPACVTGFPINGNLGRNMGITHNYFTVDMRLTRKIRFGERVNLDLIAEGFNLFNRFNEAAANPFYTVVNAFGERKNGGKYFSQPTAAYDPRQFQFGFKLNF